MLLCPGGWGWGGHLPPPPPSPPGLLVLLLVLLLLLLPWWGWYLGRPIWCPSTVRNTGPPAPAAAPATPEPAMAPPTLSRGSQSIAVRLLSRSAILESKLTPFALRLLLLLLLVFVFFFFKYIYIRLLLLYFIYYLKNKTATFMTSADLLP